MNDRLPHYPSQRDRDNAAAVAGLIVVGFFFILGVAAGFVLKAVLG